MDEASKEKVSQSAAPTGSGSHFRNVKTISWIGFNEKLMDFKGEKGGLSLH